MGRKGNAAPAGLEESGLDPNPMRQFELWLRDIESAEQEPPAMTLATVSPEGRPSARLVLLRGFDERGFVFHTNYGSRKAGELEARPLAALVFHWPQLDRQVRVEGRVHRISTEESQRYFASRPRGHRLAAWASRQGEVVAGREALEERYRGMEQRFRGMDVPLPPFWGGYRIVPDTIEFWQSRENRLHDRLRYRSSGTEWVLERLAP